MRHKLFIAFILLIAFSCKEKKENSNETEILTETEEVQIKKDTLFIEEAEEKLPELDFDSIFNEKWVFETNEKYYFDEALIYNGYIIPTNFPETLEIIDVESGKIFSLNDSSDLIKIKEVLKDSIFLFNYSGNKKVFNIISNKVLFECQVHSGRNYSPEVVKDTILITQNSYTSIAKINLKDTTKIYWLYKFEKHDRIVEMQLFDSVTVIRSESKIYAFTNNTGNLKWSIGIEKSNLIENKKSDSFLIIRENFKLLKIDIYTGDTLFSKEYPSGFDHRMIRNNEYLYFSVREEGVFKLDLSSGVNAWQYSIDRLMYFGILEDVENIYAFHDGSIIKIKKENAEKVWETPKEDFYFPAVVMDGFIVAQGYSFCEGGLPLLIDKTTGRFIAIDGLDNSFEESSSDTKNISIYLRRCQAVSGNKLLEIQGKIIERKEKTKYRLIELKY
jgi:outer membrane protein assembly factor BamB